MILLLTTLLFLVTHAWAQLPSLTLVVGRDSVGVGDTLEVRVEVDARDRALTSASAIVALEQRIFVPLSETPFTAGDFMPGQVYDNTATENGGELQLSYVAVSGTAEDGGRLAATDRGELGRFWVRAVAPSAGTLIRLVGTGAHRSIYTALDQPGVEQRFALPEQALELRVGGQAEVVHLPVETPVPESVEPVLPEPPAMVSTPVNTPPRIAPLASLAVAVGGESQGPLLASFLSDAEDEVEALRVEVAGDAQVAARVGGGRLVVRGLRAGAALVQVLVEDTQGAQASGQVQVEVRATGQGPLLRALPRMVLGVGEEKVFNLTAYVFDPDTPLAALSWTLAPEGGVEARLVGTQLYLRGIAAGSARISLEVTDPEGNMAMAALALQVEEPAAPAAPVDRAAVAADPVPDSIPETIPPTAEPPQASTPSDSTVIALPDTSAQSGNAAPAPQEDDQAQPSADPEEPAAATGEEASQVQLSADTLQASQQTGSAPAVVVSPEPGVVASTDSVHTLPETDTGQAPAAVSAAPVPDSTPETIPPDTGPPQASTPPDTAVAVQPDDTPAQSGNAAPAPQEEDQVGSSAAEEPAAQIGEQANNQVQPGADTEEPAAGASTDSIAALPETDTGQAPAAVPADPVPESPLETMLPDTGPPQASTPPDTAVAVQPDDTPAQSGNAAPAPQEEDQAGSSAAEEPAAQIGEQANNQVQPGADTEEPVAQTGEEASQVQLSADTLQASQQTGSAPAVVVSPEPGAVDTVRADSVQVLPETDTGPPPAAETLPASSPFTPIVEAPASSAPSVPPLETGPTTAAEPAADTVQVTQLLEVEPAVEYQVMAGRIDSALVVDRWIKRGEPAKVQWSLRGGKRLLARLDADTRRLYLDAREALPGRQVLFAEAVLGQERQQVTIGIGVRAPRLALLPFPTLELAAGQQLALALDSYVEGDFGPADLSWTMEAAEGAGAELDRAERVLRLSGSGDFSLVLRVSSPWGNEVEALVQVRGAVQPAATPPGPAPPPTVTAPAEPVVAPPAADDPQPEEQAPAAPTVGAGPPADQRPPLLRLEEVALGTEVELWVRADEELRLPPVVRVNGRVLEVEGRGSEYRALYTPQGSELQVQVEGEDLSGNAGQALAALAVYQVQPGSAPLRSPDGRWQAHFPQVRQESLVLFREEGEVQCLVFDAGRTGPVELVAAHSGEWPPAILRAQGQEWEELPTYALVSGTQVFARSDRPGAFKLGGHAVGVLPVQPLVYPNPFNAQAAIRYQVAGRSGVRVRVRDGQGRIVRQLVDQVQDPGVWTAPWDGRDGAGQGAASGVYFCEVEVAGQRWTGKLLLLR